jgi:beta-lactamase class A
MADAIARIVPPGIAAYAKGGSVDWQDFHALCAPGQMIIGSASVTFCFTLNWTGPDSSTPEVSAVFAKSAAGMLAAAAQCFT